MTSVPESTATRPTRTRLNGRASLEWVKASDSEPYAVNCLGRDVEVLIDALGGLDVTGDVVSISGGRWYRVFRPKVIRL